MPIDNCQFFIPVFFSSCNSLALPPESPVVILFLPFAFDDNSNYYSNPRHAYETVSIATVFLDAHHILYYNDPNVH